MKISESWLRTFVNPAISTDELASQLTMAGLEIDAVEPVAGELTGVVIGEVINMIAHPDADRLRVCKVTIGESEPLQIVCGAANVRVGLKMPTALVGARLPNDFKINKSNLRGVESFGMLCSEKELGLSAEAEGLMELPDDAPVGVNICEYLALDDYCIEVDLTPNRADCLSIEGIAREVAVLNQLPFQPLTVAPIAITHDKKLNVFIDAPVACPRYLGRLILNVNNQVATPRWMQERLRRCGLRSISALVDITNYVLLELGQPLHAFDADKIEGSITVNYAQNVDILNLLDGEMVTLDEKSLIISDDKGTLALAGVMGGDYSAVKPHTKNVFLECAFFTPVVIAGKARQFGMHTDSSHRFERGVDYQLQYRAIDRATALILQICGGDAGEITDATTESELPQRHAIELRAAQLQKILGVSLPPESVKTVLERLGMQVTEQANGWQIMPPSFRFDINIEADLIEEIARIHGYNNIPNNQLTLRGGINQAAETAMSLERLKDLLVDRGYQEAITYSFIDEHLQQTLAPSVHYIPLQNPISAELAVMRTSLWSGLLLAALHNTHRQHHRVRLFESGLRFLQDGRQTLQEKMLAGLALGHAYPEQWGEAPRPVDFFDVKADLQAMFSLTGYHISFESGEHETLHPGQTAKILTESGELMGWLGMLHPQLEKTLGFETPVFLFELSQDLLLHKKRAQFKPLSKFPSVRRDLALLVKEDVNAGDIVACIQSCDESLLQEVIVFDVYRGKGVEEGYKSVALTFVLQNQTQTLTDNEIDAIVSIFIETLSQRLGAKLRE